MKAGIIIIILCRILLEIKLSYRLENMFLFILTLY